MHNVDHDLAAGPRMRKLSTSKSTAREPSEQLARTIKPQAGTATTAASLPPLAKQVEPSAQRTFRRGACPQVAGSCEPRRGLPLRPLGEVQGPAPQAS